jgi:CXXC-20-CXXC protein
MKVCEDCNNKITYAKLFFALRTLQCSECGTKYNVNVASYIALILMMSFAVLAFNYFITALNGATQIVSICAIFLCVFILAPFNQKLVKCS